METFIIYCDESVKKGEFYGNFYGGALINSKDYDEIVKALDNKKNELGLNSEVKWTKMTTQYLERYQEFITFYFKYIKENRIKIRIMFKQNYYQSTGLSREQQQQEFFMLYYQFFKNAFGLKYSNLDGAESIFLKIYFDKLPDDEENNNKFKDFIYNLQNINDYRSNKIKIRKEDITDVDSSRHVILQGMDIIMGAMQFKLNNQNKVVDPETGRRGKKTIAKEKLYKTINSLINEFYPHFNVGISTGLHNDASNLWKHQYRHWNFISTEHKVNTTKVKNR